MRSRWVSVALGVAVLALAACSTATLSDAPVSTASLDPETATAPMSASGVNSCAYRAPEPTPTPDLTTPTSPPSPTAPPVEPTPTPPALDVVAYPDLPPPALPQSVEAWQDALVRVSVELASGRTRDQQGLVVADGAVLTVLDLTEEIASLSVRVSGRGAFAAELER